MKILEFKQIDKIMRISTKRIAAIGTSLSCKGLLLNAFTIPSNRFMKSNIIYHTKICRTFTVSNTIHRPLFISQDKSNIRLFSSLFDDNNNNKNKKEGVLSKIKVKAKSFLPKSWLSEEDNKKQASIERKKQSKKEINSSLNTMLKDAPLAIRMMSKLVIPLVSKMAETFREQGEIISNVLYEAEELIQNDDQAISVLGIPIKVGTPFSQSSGSSSINGISATKIQVSFPVQGSYQSGIATVVAASDGDTAPKIENVTIEVSGRRYSISLIKSAGGYDTFSGKTSVVGKNKVRKGDIIDAEFVDKQ